MRIFITSDTHFYSERLRSIRSGENHVFQKACPQISTRKFCNIDEMNETMFQNWNNIVNPDDLIIHLGDVGIVENKETVSNYKNKLKKLIRSLNGIKVLVLGNHDDWISKDDWIKIGFSSVCDKMNSIPGFTMTHFPMFHREGIINGMINIHGHIHGANRDFHGKKGFVSDITRNTYNASTDVNNYCPVELFDIVEACISVPE